MTDTLRQRDAARLLDLRSRRAPNAVLSGSVAIVVRGVLRDREGLIGRVVGHVLIEAGIGAERATVALVGVDRAGDTTVVERHGRADLTLRHAGRRAERLNFSIDVPRRLTPGFATEMGTRSWELRVSLGSDRIEALRRRIEVPEVRRLVRVATSPLPPVVVASRWRYAPPLLRPIDYAFAPSSEASGHAVVRSRGDWGVVDVPPVRGTHWEATIVLYEQVEAGRSVGIGTSHRVELVYSRPLVDGPNTLEFELPNDLPPSHAGPLLSTSYELRVHTADGRRLGVRHGVAVSM
ncbi:MAG: hypothetical protein R2733_04965 [Acidimicrobiales bacterium]